MEVVLPSAELGVEVVPGLWPTGEQRGLVFVGNATDFDQAIEKGDRVGVVARAAVQTRVCGVCRAEDSEAWVVEPDARGCKACGAQVRMAGLSCRQCGADRGLVAQKRYAGCAACGHSRLEARRSKPPAVDGGSQALVAAERPVAGHGGHDQEADLPHR